MFDVLENAFMHYDEFAVYPEYWGRPILLVLFVPVPVKIGRMEPLLRPYFDKGREVNPQSKSSRLNDRSRIGCRRNPILFCPYATHLVPTSSANKESHSLPGD